MFHCVHVANMHALTCFSCCNLKTKEFLLFHFARKWSSSACCVHELCQSMLLSSKIQCGDFILILNHFTQMHPLYRLTISVGGLWLRLALVAAKLLFTRFAIHCVFTPLFCLLNWDPLRTIVMLLVAIPTFSVFFSVQSRSQLAKLFTDILELRFWQIKMDFCKIKEAIIVRADALLAWI